MAPCLIGLIGSTSLLELTYLAYLRHRVPFARQLLQSFRLRFAKACPLIWEATRQPYARATPFAGLHDRP